MPNRLAKETSPYLLQHAGNPVDWYPWSEEALQKAKDENKPILLSIGYAACHWCHVMAHESFEDDETAKLMNELFINIKVDKEERPDLDKIYQTTHYLLTHRNGGWPLTVFLTPDDLTPFYSGTYFPKMARYQLPAFKDLLTAIREAYDQQKEEIKKQNKQLVEFLNQKTASKEDINLSQEPIAEAVIKLASHYDQTYGGFGEAPKFPQPKRLEFLLKFKPELAINTMQHMMKGGIYDQLEGGFFRYSVDQKWEIPHFEKMLYDNAQLLGVYSQGYRLTEDNRLKEVALATAAWLIQNMQSPTGGFYSSLDADQEGVEGKYYLFNEKELHKILQPKYADILKKYYGFDKAANIEDQWHLTRRWEDQELAKEFNLSLDVVKEEIQNAKIELLATRKLRNEPNLDKKILTAWNALTITGLLQAAVAFNENMYLEAADRCLHFFLHELKKKNQLQATYNKDKRIIHGYLDDYAFLIDALRQRLELDWNNEHYEFLMHLSKEMISMFYDKENGGFYFTPETHEKLLYRPKTLMDEATPSGNGIAIINLLIIGFLTGKESFLDIAERSLKNAWSALKQFPAEHCTLLLALNIYLNPPEIIILRGKKDLMAKWRIKLKNQGNIVLSIASDVKNLPDFLQDKKPQGDICAYVCKGTSCTLTELI